MSMRARRNEMKGQRREGGKRFELELDKRKEKGGTMPKKRIHYIKKGCNFSELMRERKREKETKIQI